jgi:hypothetical protein
MVLGIRCVDAPAVKNARGIVGSRWLMRRSGIARYRVRAIGVSENHDKVAHASDLEKPGKFGDVSGCTAQKIVAQSQILNGISGEC